MKPLIVTPFVALLVTGEALAAERRPQGSGVVVRGAAGLGVGRIDVAGENETEPGFAGGALFGVAGQRFEFDVELAFQPFKVDNPAGRESFRVLYVLPSVRFHGRHAYLRLAAGWARYSWYGPAAFVPSDTGPALSAAAGYEFASPRAIPVSIEAYIRASTSDFEFTSRLYGVQLVASWYQRK